MSLTILRASAGSGKTYALTLNYLELLLKENRSDYFRSILAVTFTNKATQEMKSRILKELEAIAGGAVASGMGKALLDTLKLSESELQQRAHSALVCILHNYSHFSVSTIDSFFQKVVRSFAREADLQANYKIELNTAQVLEELTDQLLNKAEHDKHLQDWLVQFSREQLSQGKSWDIRRNLYKLIGEVVKEGFMEQSAGLDVLHKEPAIAQTFLQKLKGIKYEFENEMRKIGENALQAIENAGLKIEDFSHGKSGAVGYFIKIAQGTDFEPGARVFKVLSGEDNWYSKAQTKEIKGIIDGLSNDCLLIYLGEAVTFYSNVHPAYNSACAVLEHFTSCALLGHYLHLLQNYRTEKGALLISDVADLLNKIIDNDDAPFVYEKIGNRYNHFLIDEFQDTSLLHWNNFRPLLSNSIGSGHRNLIVGDPKQSIYRWRGGDLRLMLQDVKAQLQQVDENALENNWRSCPEVIEFNNCLFQNAASLVAEQAAESMRGTSFPDSEQAILQNLLANIDAVYHNSDQLFPETKSNGHQGFVQVQFLQDKSQVRKEPKISFKQQARVLLLNNLQHLTAQGYTLQDIALLVRSNGEARELATYLSTNGYDVLSEEALQINTAQTVKLLLSVLQLLHNIKNKPAIATAIKLYAKIHKAPQPDAAALRNVNPGVIKDLEGLLPSDFLASHISLSRMALYDLCSRLTRMFGLDAVTEEEHYLEAFLNEVHRYSHEEKGDLGGFLDWWDTQGYKQSLKREQAPNAIRILTVHKSKGLQYPVVLIPYCNWNLDVDTQGKTNIIWAGCQKPDAAVSHSSFFAGLPLANVPVSYKSGLSSTYFGFELLQEKFQAYLDNLNLLYVALTRAEEALLITAEEVKDPKSKTWHVGRVLHDCLGHMKSAKATLSDKLGEISFDYTQHTFGELPSKLAQADEVILANQSAPHTPLHTWDDILRLRRNAKPIYIQQNAHISASIDHGTLVHDVLAKVKYEDALPDVLERMQLAAEISKKDADLIREKLNTLLGIPQVASWFCKDWTVLNEQPILSTNGQVHRPDRIILKDKKAVLIDYKTGERKKSYHDQLKRYKQQLERMGYSVEAYLLYINEENPIEQVTA